MVTVSAFSSDAAGLPKKDEENDADAMFMFGFVWSGLMFFSAALNVIVTLNVSVVAWASFMSIYAIVSKAALFLIAYATMRYIGVRRRRAQMIPAIVYFSRSGDILTTGWSMIVGAIQVCQVCPTF
jgi:hypothetical protein